MEINNRKIVVIGIDGATFKIIRRLTDAGKLPNLSAIMRNGVSGELNSTIPCVSPVAWTSFMTGQNPDKHQIFDFSGKVSGTYNFTVNTASSRKTKPIWINISDNNKRVLVAGVTMTYPPDPVNGYMVSGLGAPTESDMRSCFFPPEFADELRGKIGAFRTVPEADMRKLGESDSEKEKYLNSIFEQIDHRVKLFKHMWQKEHFDFSMLFFLDTDGISHYFWRYMDADHKSYSPGPYSEYIYRVYEKVDSAVGELIATVGEDFPVMLMSDHGFGPLNRLVFLNNWLSVKGYLKFKEPSWTKSIVSKIAALLGRPHKIDIDWQKTKAYFNGTVGNVYVNLEEREPAGTVKKSEYKDFCNGLKDELLKMRDGDTGPMIVERVYTREELFENHPDAMPDLFVVFKKGYNVVGEEIQLHNIRDKGDVIADANNWSGTHEPEGIFLASGGDFKKCFPVKDANIIDVAPTILYYLGIPIPEGMDGKPMTNIFNDDFIKLNKVLYTGSDNLAEAGKADVLGGSEDEEVMERLRNLGYIE